MDDTEATQPGRAVRLVVVDEHHRLDICELICRRHRIVGVRIDGEAGVDDRAPDAGAGRRDGHVVTASGEREIVADRRERDVFEDRAPVDEHVDGGCVGRRVDDPYLRVARSVVGCRGCPGDSHDCCCSSADTLQYTSSVSCHFL